MNMIVAADKKNGIGYHGKLLVTIPFDLAAVSKGNDRKGRCHGTKNSGEPSSGRVLEGRTNIVTDT